MSMRTLSGVLVLSFLLGVLQAAPPERLLPLDLIPSEACIGIAIRDLKELKARADKLLKDQRNLPRFSEAFDELHKRMKLPWAIDEKAPSALICATGKLGGFADKGNEINNFTISTVLAAQDMKEVLRKWKLDPETVKKGTPQVVPGETLLDPYFRLKQVRFQDRHVYLSGSGTALEAWKQAKTLRMSQPPERLKRLDAADGLVYLGPPLFQYIRLYNSFDPEWAPSELNEQEKQAHRQMNRAIVEARTFLAAYRLGDGIGVDFTVGFDPQGKESQKLLRALDTKATPSSLSGLPVSGPILGALSLGGVASHDVTVARLLATEFWLGWRSFPYLLESDAPLIRRLLGDLYGRMKTLRGALYLTTEKEKTGPLALVAILEPRDADALLRELNQLTRLVDGKAFDPRGEAGKAEIAKLVRDLGSDDYDLREAASTRLALIGEPALDALAQAEKSDDPEVRRRAGEIRTQYQLVANLRKQEEAKGLLKQAFQPQFRFQEKAEMRAGVPVHHLGLSFDMDNAPFSGWFKDLFGPDWNRIRLAQVGDRVVALMGSDTSLLDQAIQNVRDGKPGLQQSTALENFRKQAGTGHLAELHVALGLLRQFTTPADKLPADFKPTPSLSSLGFRTGTADLGFDFWVPPDAVGDGFFWFFR